MGDTEAQIQALLDKQAITEQIANYGRCMDRLDREIGRAVFHPEATVDYGRQMFQGSGWEFVDWVVVAHLGFVVHSHQFCNISIRLEGDIARSETYGDVTLRRRDEAGQYQDIRNLGRYIDLWLKRAGTWRILNRKYLHDMDECRASAGHMFETTGRRDRQDESYFPNPDQAGR